MKFDDDVLKNLQNTQIQPARSRVEINDKTAKLLFGLTVAQYVNVMRGSRFSVIEKKNHPKHGKISAPLSLRNESDFFDYSPLTEIERDVLSACISEWANGTLCITPAIVFRALSGKVGEVGVSPCKVQLAAINNALIKLRKTNFNKMFAEAYNLLNYKTDGLSSEPSPLLPSEVAPAKINGQPYQVIFFTAEPPLLTHAALKNQIVRYDAHLLDVPNMNNTPRIIAIKNYIMRRICEIKLHKQLAPTLRFDTIFKNCRIENLDRKSKSNARNIIFRFFEHLKQQGFIDSYEVNKNKMGNVYHSITFTYTDPKKVAQKNSAQSKGAFNAANSSYSNSSPSYNNSSTPYSNSSPSYSNSSPRRKKRKAKKSKNQ